MVALPIYAIGLLGGASMAPGLGWLTAALVVGAAANSVVDVGMNVHGVAVERHIGRPILSRLNGAFSVGAIAGAGAGALAAHSEVGFRLHFLVVSAIALVAGTACLVWLLPPEPAPRPAHRPASDGCGRLGWGWSPAALTLGMLAFGVVLPEGAAQDWTAAYLHQDLAAPQGIAASGFLIFAVAMAAGRLLGDWLVLRIGARASFVGGLLFGGAGFAICLQLSTMVAGLVGFAVLGLGASYALPLLLRAAGRQRNSAATVAWTSTLGYLGSFTGPGAIGALAVHFGLGRALLLPALVLVVAAAVAAALGGRSYLPSRGGDSVLRRR